MFSLQEQSIDSIFISDIKKYRSCIELKVFLNAQYIIRECQNRGQEYWKIIIFIVCMDKHELFKYDKINHKSVLYFENHHFAEL